MNKLLLGTLVIMILSGSVFSVFANPKAKQTTPIVTPHPANVLISVTIKMTDFAMHRITGEQDNMPSGMKHPELRCRFRDVLPKGESRNYVRQKKGVYGEPGYTDYHYFTCSHSDLKFTEVSADDLRDVFGSDAIQDVKEIPWDEFQRQVQANDIQSIQVALNKSKGNTTEAVERLKMNGINITEQELSKKVDQYHLNISAH